MECIVQTPTPNLQESLAFYQKLEYQVISASDPALVTDGKAVIEINPERPARAGLKFYQNNWDKELTEFEKFSAVKQSDGKSIVTDPNGVFVYLETGNAPKLGKTANDAAIPGNFMGISIESLNFDKSIDFWSVLGYQVAAGAKDQGWVSLSNGTDLGISIMTAGICPHLFFNPSFTYFNGGNNLEVIDKVRNAGVAIVEEITAFNKEGIVDNIIIRDPGGFGFFIFND